MVRAVVCIDALDLNSRFKTLAAAFGSDAEMGHLTGLRNIRRSCIACRGQFLGDTLKDYSGRPFSHLIWQCVGRISGAQSADMPSQKCKTAGYAALRLTRRTGL
jgi:hypothetical protein